MLGHMLAAWLHDLDPFLVRFPDVAFLPAGIRWYGLSYLVGFLLGFLLIRRVLRVGITPLRPEQTADLVVVLAIAIVVGGRVGYVLFYEPALLIEFGRTPPFWGLLAINKGGMASHGGILGFILGTFYFARRHQVSWAHLLDIGAFAGPLGVAFGRVANFINGELFGRPCSPDFPLAVKFPQAILEWPEPKVQALYAALYDAGFTGPLSVRGIIAAVQAGQRDVIAVVEPMLAPRHPSQLYQAALEGVLLFLLLAWIWRKPRKPLVIGCWFFIIYGALRIVGEFFREPDAHIRHQEFELLHVTRGQWLSMIMVVLGATVLLYVIRRPVAKLGGWRRPGDNDDRN